MDLLKRELAPILPQAWTLIDAEASRVLRLHLAGRKLVDFRGPFGWTFAAVNTGRLDILPHEPAHIAMGVRTVQPVVEVRVPIKLSLMELDTVARGAEDPDLTAVVQAAEQVALVEDTAIFNGLARAHIQGILAATPHAPLARPNDVRELPGIILDAIEVLRRSGVDGPYVMVLGRTLYDQVYAAREDGYPLVRRLDGILDKPLVRADALDSTGVLLSIRGADYELTVGQDLSIGYAYHTKDEVELYLTESFTFRVLEPVAAVRIG
jgi:uncharacterized linocin/CFP29 family protein